jgi:hypothetical protein
MLKGVNKLIIEVNNPESEFFERAIFFVRPDKSEVISKTASGDMNESVRGLMHEASGIRARKKSPRNKKYALLKLAGAAGLGAAVMGAILKLL